MPARACLAALLACIAITTAASAQIAPGQADPRIALLVDAISEARLRSHVERLVQFGTRHTLSSASSPARGIGAARQWLLDELQRASPRLQVAFDTFRVAPQGRILRETELRNVIAVLPGRSARRIYLTAHYDTVNIPGGQNGANATRAPGAARKDPQLDPEQDFDAAAPGANDNGSGVALTLELARVLANSGLEFDATLVFALWAGEEQGLVGARLHARRAADQGHVVAAVFNNDIVGNSQGGAGRSDSASVRLYAEGPEDSSSRALARFVREAAAHYVPSHRVRLIARLDRFGRGSDHAPFVQAGFPAVVFRESVENFGRQHNAADTLDGVDAAYLARNARVNAAAIAALALAPPAPVVVDARGVPMLGRRPTGYDAELTWQPSPGAVGYRVFWRDAWTPDWQHALAVGAVTTHVLPGLSIDDVVIGVAAVGAGGHESPVSAYVAPPRRDPDVKLAAGHQQ